MRKTRRTQRRSASKKITQNTLKRIVQNEVKTIQESKKAQKRPVRRKTRNKQPLNEAKTVENGQRFFKRYLSLLAEAFVNNGYSEKEAKRRAVAYTKKWMPTKVRKSRKARR
jgi:hypothetical protein